MNELNNENLNNDEITTEEINGADVTMLCFNVVRTDCSRDCLGSIPWLSTDR